MFADPLSPNVFGDMSQCGPAELPGMDAERLRAATAAPADRPCELLDARELPPPEPLQRTLEWTADANGAVLVQVNDRAPQHLYPRLTERGFEYDTAETDDGVVTAVWEE
ncbi:DUF2249 domain-containing protein [Haloarchaeobius sp. FL176]|uniref:DUF2249 domain-containing protein n=1 Tax=Haloarchaeobius sp. FL176 TaxID=2967129 RepID=UPI0034E95AE7